MKPVTLFQFLLLIIYVASCNQTNEIQWEEGYLEIHQIRYGKGNAAFFIFPDGTTMLFDAGAAEERVKDPFYPLYPTDTLTPGKLITHYINQVNPSDSIDYAVISHFHSDHFGYVGVETPIADNGRYRLSGITEVGHLIPIKKIIDRDYPNYDYHEKMLGVGKLAYDNYKLFNDYRKENHLVTERLIAGKNNQIILKKHKSKFPDFSVRNIKSNQWIWSGNEDEVFEFIFDPPLFHPEGKILENPLSIALKIEYGDFDFFTGGDLPGVDGNYDYDIESSIAPIVGEVDVLTLNHHGYLDANNSNFIKNLKPQVAIHPTLHDPHYQKNVLTNLANQGVDVYSLAISDSVKIKFQTLLEKTHKSVNGHVMLRVMPGGEEFVIFQLRYGKNGLKIKEKYGPYKSRN